ncbi:MAG: sugar phosphate isomerase/epimerase family protein [Promethearchaeota archaeon]
MKYAINQATILSADLINFINESSKYFQAIELRAEKIREYLELENALNNAEAKKEKLANIKELIKENGLKLISLNSLEDFNLSDEDTFEKKIIPYLNEMLEYCDSLGCDLIIVVPSFFHPDNSNPSWEQIKEKSVMRLKILGEITKKHNVRIGLEPLGFNDCSIRTVKEGMDVISSLSEDLDNIGYVIDTCHFFVGLNPISAISLINKLYLIHVSDVACDLSSDLSWITDSNRVMVGQGSFPFNSFFKEVKKSLNYDGYISLELFNEAYWKDNPSKVLQEAIESLKKIKL